MAGEGLGTGLLPALVGEWRLLYTSSNAMEYNQVNVACVLRDTVFLNLRFFARVCFVLSAVVCARAISRLLYWLLLVLIVGYCCCTTLRRASSLHRRCGDFFRRTSPVVVKSV